MEFGKIWAQDTGWWCLLGGITTTTTTTSTHNTVLYIYPPYYIFPLPHLYADIFDDAPHRQLDIDYSHNRLLQNYIKNYIKIILFALFACFEVYVDGVGAPGSVETKSHSLTLLTFKRVEFT